MKRLLTSPNRDTTIINTLQPYEGGTGATTLTAAQANLDMLASSRLGQANGPAMMPMSGGLTSAMFTGSADSGVTLSGPTSVSVSTSNTYTITNYDIATTYTVSGTGGTVSVSGDVVTYVANDTIENGTIVVNGKSFTVVKYDQIPSAPTVTVPVDNATGIGSSVSFTSSAFSTQKVGDTHASSDWEVSTNNGFTAVVKSSYSDATNKTSITFTGLSVSTTYYMRVRYRSSSGKVGDWSGTKVFSTKASFVPSSEQAKLTASDGATGDNFGYSVSLSSDGSTALVGAYGVDPSGKDAAGAAYIFTRSGSTWTQQAKLTASDGVAYDRFGYSTSISSDGNTALISALGRNSATGAAYIFTRSGTTWTQGAILTASNGSGNDAFGWSVSLSSDGTFALVSAPSKYDNVGISYVFTRSGSTWSQQAIINASDSGLNYFFGSSVSLSSDGSTALIGSNRKNSSIGAAYIFTRSGTTWTQQSIITANDPGGNFNFGISTSLSADGNTAVIGANKINLSAGAAYIFTRSGSTWSQQAKLTPNDGAFYDQFGISVSLSSDGNIALVGSHNSDPSGKSDAGAAYIFTRSGTTWSQQAKLTSSAADSYWFGYSVSLSSDGTFALASHYVVGSGNAYIYA